MPSDDTRRTLFAKRIPIFAYPEALPIDRRDKAHSVGFTAMKILTKIRERRRRRGRESEKDAKARARVAAEGGGERVAGIPHTSRIFLRSHACR